MNIRHTMLVASLLVLTACGDTPEPAAPAAPEPATAPPQTQRAPATSAEAFFAAFGPYCGQSFAGRITANAPPPESADPFDGKPLVMHIRECSADTLRIPFHVGDDHSRIWVVMRTATGLRLKHDHRHEDGARDPVTMYGGDSVPPGSPTRQEFPVDADSIALFETHGLAASVTNIWAIEIEPGQRFIYELGRPGRLFRVEFDLTQPVATPPAPWGADG